MNQLKKFLVEYIIVLATGYWYFVSVIMLLISMFSSILIAAGMIDTVVGVTHVKALRLCFLIPIVVSAAMIILEIFIIYDEVREMQKEVKEISTEEFLEMVKSRKEFMIFVDLECMEREVQHGKSVKS